MVSCVYLRFNSHSLPNSSLIWSVCCTVNEDGRKKMDAFVREKEGCFPLKDTIYEYYVDVRKRCFVSWEDKLQDSWRYETG